MTDSLHMPCPKCNEICAVTDRYGGKKVLDCPRCGARTVVV